MHRIMRYWGTVSVYLLFISIALVGCAQKPEEAIIGTWQLEDSQSTVMFTTDGTVISDGTIVGNYRFVGDESGTMMAMKMDGWLYSPELIFAVNIRGNRMTLIAVADSSQQMRFIRR
ncbi:hypothetical protein HC928_21520 [bacterium]|nr:hypothetical protein [bacterium]